MPVLKRDPQYVPQDPIGFDNLGATCYFNSLLQALLSCSNLTKAFIQIELNDSPSAGLALIYKNMCSKLDQLNQHRAGILWKSFMKSISKRTDSLDASQQCAGEALRLFLEALSLDLGQCLGQGTPKVTIVDRLFYHRMAHIIQCCECLELTNQYSVDAILHVTIESIDKFQALEAGSDARLCFEQDTLLKDYQCQSCKTRGLATKKERLVMVPEILTVMIKRYNNKGQKLTQLVQLPEVLQIGPHSYKAVAQIEHQGSLSGGHYWANCLRRTGWYTLNDTSCSKSEGFRPSGSTYITFYERV